MERLHMNELRELIYRFCKKEGNRTIARALTMSKNTVKKYRRKAFAMNQYTAIVKQDGDWWIGWIQEIPGVNCQEKTREELMETLHVTLAEAIEMNRQDALEAASTDYEQAIVNL